jgi:hypothetical protein
MTEYVYVLMLFSKMTINSGQDLNLIEAELRLDPVSCMMQAQVINSGATEDDARIAACMPVLWLDDRIDPEIIEKRN